MEPDDDADTTVMKSKVSPRLLVPLGIAVLLLLGFGAMRVLGGEDEPAATEATELPSASEASQSGIVEVAADAVAEITPPAGGVDDSVDGTPVVADEGEETTDWARQADQICSQAVSDLVALSGSVTPDAATEAGAEALEISRAAVESLKAVPPTPGSEDEIAEYIRLLEQSLDAADKLLASSGDINPDELGVLIEQQVTIAARIQELGASLGVGACLDASGTGEDAAATSNDSIAVQALEDEVGSKGLLAVVEALEQNESVVVVVYSPSAELDSTVLRETRAAADESGAGFVVINGNKEREVRLVAETFDLRETPATLVVNEGLVVSTKLVGFADRETVSQAVTNAHQSS